MTEPDIASISRTQQDTLLNGALVAIGIVCLLLSVLDALAPVPYARLYLVINPAQASSMA